VQILLEQVIKWSFRSFENNYKLNFSIGVFSFTILKIKKPAENLKVEVKHIKLMKRYVFLKSCNVYCICYLKS
jgi:hypothetical protein